jgi:hypothetical protein
MFRVQSPGPQCYRIANMTVNTSKVMRTLLLKIYYITTTLALQIQRGRDVGRKNCYCVSPTASKLSNICIIRGCPETFCTTWGVGILVSLRKRLIEPSLKFHRHGWRRKEARGREHRQASAAHRRLVCSRGGPLNRSRGASCRAKNTLCVGRL